MKKNSKKVAVNKAARPIARPRARGASAQPDGLDAFYAARDQGFAFSKQYMERLRAKPR